jgi:hypothetical protein
MTRWAGARRVEIERSGVNVPNGFQPRKFTAAIVSFVIKRMVSTGIDRFVQVAEGKANNRQPG